MTLEDVLTLIRSIAHAEHYYIGFLDAKHDKSIGIYQGRAADYSMPISKARGSQTKNVRLLIHWGKDSVETEAAAQDLFSALEGIREHELGAFRVDFVRLVNSEPIDVGPDDRAVFERVIECEIYYQKKGD